MLSQDHDKKRGKSLINLERFSKRVNKHRGPDGNWIDLKINCPESGKAYSVDSMSKSVTHYIIQCPNPELHNLKRLYIIYNKGVVQMEE